MPRNIAGAVARGEDFWGREADVNRMWELLERGHVLLSGQRRTGKSSLMWALHDRPRDGWKVLLVEVEYVDDPADFLTLLAAEMLRHEPLRRLFRAAKRVPAALQRWFAGIVEELGAGLPELGELRIKLREQAPAGAEWADLADQLFGQLRALDGKLLLIIDEFPMMVANMLDRDEATAIRFLRWFRSWRQTAQDGRPRILLGGSVNIEPELVFRAQESLINDMERFRLLPLAEAQAVEFVYQVLSGEQARFEDEVPFQLVKTVGSGWQYYLQVTIAECLAHARHLREPVRAVDVRNIFDEQVLGPACRARFSHYHSRLRERYRDTEVAARTILYELCRRDAMDMGALERAVQSAGHDTVYVEQVLAMLESDFYLVRDRERWSFSDGFLRAWWARNAVAPRRRA